MTVGIHELTGSLEAQGRGISAPASSTPDRIPLRVGLTIVTTVTGESQGDFESIKQVTEATPQLLRFTYTGDRRPNSTDRVKLERTQRQDDLARARDINTFFSAGQPEAVTGATTFTVSAQVLQELKSKGIAAVGHIVGEGGKDFRYPVVLRKIDGAPYQTILNGAERGLATVHVKSSPGDVDQAEFFFLDDPENPLVLWWQSSIRGGKPFGARVIKLEDARASQSRACEDRRVEVYGIYFDFNSDSIRPESEPVIKGIAEAMKAKPACRLNIEGHTDNVGGPAFNLDLSNRRAAAVKRALVESHGIQSDRLGTSGLGLSKPKASNDTAEGRAQNRRVELVQQ